MARERRAAHLSYLLLILAALFWSGNVVLGRGLSDELPPLALNFWRWAGALAILLPFSWHSLAGKGALVRRHWKILLVLGVLGISAFNSLAYTAFQTTTAINAALINAAMPAMVMALLWAGFGGPITVRQGVGIAVSFAGTLVILARGEVGILLTLDLTVGDLWMTLAVALYALYSVLLRYRPPALDGLALLTVITGFGVAVMVPVAIAEALLVGPMPVSASSLGMVSYVALFPSVLAYAFWNRGVATVGPDRTAMFTHLVPVFTAVLAIVFLGESLRPFHGVGMALVFGGLVLATRVPAYACAR
jgi:drug/metabolite transporter (DMT)-like permease